VSVFNWLVAYYGNYFALFTWTLLHCLRRHFVSCVFLYATVRLQSLLLNLRSSKSLRGSKSLKVLTHILVALEDAEVASQ